MQELFTEPEAEERPKSKVVLIVVGSLLLAAIPLSLALFLGDWAFDYRRLSLHQGRMERLVQREPTLGQVMAGLEGEGATLLAAPSNAPERTDAAARWGGERSAVLEKLGSEHSTMRVFQAGDVVYFLFFGEDEILKDFAVVPGTSSP